MCYFFLSYLFLQCIMGCHGYRILGYRVSQYSEECYDLTRNMIPELITDHPVQLEIFGYFSNDTEIGITTEKSCLYSLKPVKRVKYIHENKMEVTIVAKDSGKTFFCLRSDENNYNWSHQGTEPALTLVFRKQVIPSWVFYAIMICAVVLSAFFNGLSLAMLSLDITQLQIMSNTGEMKERERARTILPLRKRGHLLLCSILLASTVCNTAFTVCMEQNVIQGWQTVIISTLIIVVLCEIIPCAVVTRYALLVCSKTICLTKTVIVLAFPISYPLSKILDLILSKEISIYTKDRIKELVKLTSTYNQMRKQEVDIISGALEMTVKKVEDVMTPLEDVFMLSTNCYLDYITVADIMKSGYSRIPVFEGERSNIVGILYAKDLAILDPEDKLNIKTMINLFNFPCSFVQKGTTLDSLFQIFKEGIKGHMAFVYKSEKQMDDGKIAYEVIGLVTMEDVIEELIQSEIFDEHDDPGDSRYTRKRDKRRLMASYLSTFSEKLKHSDYMTEQLKIAAYQFLSNAVDAFKQDVITANQLHWLLDQKVVFFQERNPNGVAEPIFSNTGFHQGFILILEGKVDVFVGEENLKFESGPFTYFGLPSLSATDNDMRNINYSYRVEARSEVKYLKIARELYVTAKERSQTEIMSLHGA